MVTLAEPRILIAGAGPTGLMLACELARRAVPFRLVDLAAEPFRGSRGKGLQPRTLEIFHDLGILPQVLELGSQYLPFRMHAFGLSVPAGSISKTRAATPDVPYPNVWMIPQWRTEEILRARLSELGGRVEYGVALTGLTQDESGVHATLTSARGSEVVRCDYLAGCDGGRSAGRKLLGVRLEGEALAAQPVVVADVTLTGLDRAYWHVWPRAKGCSLTLCPLPGVADFQLAAPLRKNTPVPELTEDGIRRFVAAAIGGKRVAIQRVGWASVYRPHVRMVDRYQVGRVFLAGDAAHVHPPTGGQGLNTGIQDAYNLGWKLAAVVAGAPVELLESYEAERLPVAASVLGLSKRLQLSGSARRGKETQQLDLTYRGGPLAHDTRSDPGTLRAGDRAPDAPCADASGRPRRLFDEFRGVHWTLLVFGAHDANAFTHALAPWGDTLRVVHVVDRSASVAQGAEASATLIDGAGHASRAYGVSGEAAVLVRPDGHIGLFAAHSAAEVERYLALVFPGRGAVERAQSQRSAGFAYRQTSERGDRR